MGAYYAIAKELMNGLIEEVRDGIVSKIKDT
jgi:hypothetical protein